jgi:hypothetical protein
MMRIQEITRNGAKYYHIYLPKNIVENVLQWQGKDNLNFYVVGDKLVLSKEEIPLALSSDTENPSKSPCALCEGIPSKKEGCTEGRFTGLKYQKIR